MLATEIRRCRLCDGGPVETVFDLGVQAVAGRFPAEGDPEVPKAPLRLVKCANCDLVQLAHDFDVETFFCHDYGYRSGINATMREHLAGIVRRVEGLVALEPGDTVLDIASNDGTLLKNYTASDIRRVGIDPTISQYWEHYPEDVVTVPSFFTADRFRAACPGAKARVITSIAVVYDLPDPKAFAADVAAILAEDGVWVLEQSDLGMMIQACSFDTICHEHVEYYGLRQIGRLVDSQDLRIFDVQFNDINGGSAQMFVCHRDGPYAANESTLAEAAQAEEDRNLDSLETFERFRRSSERVRHDLHAFLERQRGGGKTVHLYGASTKGNVLLQFCGIDRSLVAAAADRNPGKWGRRTPGTGIPIISEQESRAARPDYFLVLPWHFRAEFIDREADFIASGGRLVFPLPALDIYPPLEGMVGAAND